jgi:hypothetical protein
MIELVARSTKNSCVFGWLHMGRSLDFPWGGWREAPLIRVRGEGTRLAGAQNTGRLAGQNKE